MKDDIVNFPNMERVNVIGGRYPKLMEILDPIPFWFVEKLAKDELVKLVEAGLEYQRKLVDLEMARLKIHNEALMDMHKIIKGF